MSKPISLEDHLRASTSGEATALAVSQVILALAGAGRTIGATLARAPLAGDLGTVQCAKGGGDFQSAFDVTANELVLQALRPAPVAFIGSEELEAPIANRAGAPVSVAVDPLDGSSNIDTNVSIGTIFSIVPAPADGAAPFAQTGSAQLAAGFLIYGPSTALVFTRGNGTHIFALDPESGEFRLAVEQAAIPATTREYAINASNYRHWNDCVRLYVDDCLAGADGPRGENFNTRWIASLVAEAFRILKRGGVYLYPADVRRGYGRGRLRLVYEAFPIAFLVEQAGGAATDGTTRILDLAAGDLHERVPFVFGSREEVERIARYHTSAHTIAERAPLFGRRGLFRQ